MAITNVGLSKTSGALEYANGCKVHAGDGSPPLYLMWRTVSGAEINKTFDIAINYRYIPSGNLSGEAAGYTDWQTDWTTWTTLELSECNGVQLSDQSGWQWSHDLASLLEACGVKAAFTDSDKFPFLLRKFDQAQIDVHIKSNYKQPLNGEESSPRTDASVWIGYVPEYEVEGIYIDGLDHLVIEYSAAGWGRADDRWSLEALEVGGESLIASKPWGTVVRPYDASTGYGNGKVVVPMEKLARIPVGESVRAKVRFNASYRASGSEFAEAELTETCSTSAGCNDPDVTVVREGDGVVVSVAADSSISSVLVKMEGARFEFDQVAMAPGSSAVFGYVPKDTPLTFSALAVDSQRKVSNLVRKSLAPIPSTSSVMVASLSNPSLKAAAKLNVRLGRAYSPARKTVKLAGRERETALYGEGGSANLNLSFSALPESVEPDPIYGEDAWNAVSDGGDCVLFRNGGRALVSIGAVDFSYPHDAGGVAAASVSLTEVSE